MRLPNGIYERLLDVATERLIGEPGADTVSLRTLQSAETPLAFARHLLRSLQSAFSRLPEEDGQRLRVDLANEILRLASNRAEASDLLDRFLAVPPRELLEVFDADTGGAQNGPRLIRPDTPLSSGCILTGSRLDPTLESQIRKEMVTADRVDFLCSFIKWGGIRTLRQALEAFVARPSSGLRVLTTCYTGATDIKAVDYLASLPRSRVRVSYDTEHTRMHAKAYLFYRKTGFSTAYVGSANLSRAAMTEGLEWVVKISEAEAPHLWEKLIATFDSYWHDPEFPEYSEAERPQLVSALAAERGPPGTESTIVFELSPHEFQREILDQIEAERVELAKTRHLVVSATGTGKTMIAAFDYRRIARVVPPGSRRPTLLYVVHREEILKQARQKFRHVLRDMDFGEVLAGGAQPSSLNYLFCTIQSYNARALWEQPSDFYDYIVVDEFHHAAATSYQRLLAHVRPKVLLALTATPERADLKDVFAYFGGSASAEIRLPDAVNRKLLCPFQYFGVSDTEDLSDIRWVRGAYDVEQLSLRLSANQLRAQTVVDKVREITTDPRLARGLGFCVGVEHAKFMAAFFTAAGIPAEVLSADSPRAARESVGARLVRREINFIFTVDLYNEGVDIPEVDTVLFLRPTESLTVFLQQLGRGLRHCDGKDSLTVIDLVGRQHESFRYDHRFRALLSDASRDVEDEVKGGFPHLPAGCSITLERTAREHVLKSIRHAVIRNKSGLRRAVTELAGMLGHAPTFAEFLTAHGMTAEEFYSRQISFSRLAAETGRRPDFTDPDEERLTKGLARICHADDPAWIRSLLGWLEDGSTRVPMEDLSDPEYRHAVMAHMSLWSRANAAESAGATIDHLRVNPVMAGELSELLRWNRRHLQHVCPVLELPFPCALSLHCRYTLHEALAGLGHWSMNTQPEFREGPLHLKSVRADAFFVTLDKTDKDYSPTTMYEDYAISDRLFHWQSQNATGEETETGRRYREHESRGHTILLFVRESKHSAVGAAPYHFLGPARYISHEGSRPMSIVWELRHAIPAVLTRGLRRAIS